MHTFLTRFLFVFFSIAIGLYPIAYLLVDMSNGLLASKPVEVIQSGVWQAAFYQHIFLGGIALLIGWSQFSKKLRSHNLTLHRNLGKVYLIAVAFSGSAGSYIALHASGGMVAVLGFSALGIGWLFTTLRGYQVILQKNVNSHQSWMIRSYALCWAAVTLRLWIPLLQIAFGMEFLEAYKIVAWLCWIPNLMVAELIIAALKKERRTIKSAEKTISV